MSERQLGVDGWKLRTAFDSVSDGREKVTRKVEKNRKLRSKKDMTKSKERQEEKESTGQSKNETKSRNSQILMVPRLRVAMSMIRVMKNKGVLNKVRNRFTDVGET